MRLFWTPAKLARTRAAVRAYNAAITRAEKSGVPSEQLPQHYTVAEIREMVGEDINAYRRIVGYKNDVKRGRSSMLTRPLKTVTPNAFEINPKTGNTYLFDKEVRLAQQRDSKRAKGAIARMSDEEIGELLGQARRDIEERSLEAMAEHMVNNDLRMPKDTDYMDWYDIEDSYNAATQSTIANMVSNFMDVWRDMKNLHMSLPGYDDVIDQIYWMRDNTPDILMEAFRADWLQIDWIYITPHNEAWAAIDYTQRHNTTVRKVGQLYDAIQKKAALVGAYTPPLGHRRSPAARAIKVDLSAWADKG